MPFINDYNNSGVAGRRKFIPEVGGNQTPSSAEIEAERLWVIEDQKKIDIENAWYASQERERANQNTGIKNMATNPPVGADTIKFTSAQSVKTFTPDPVELGRALSAAQAAENEYDTKFRQPYRNSAEYQRDQQVAKTSVPAQQLSGYEANMQAIGDIETASGVKYGRGLTEQQIEELRRAKAARIANGIK